MTSPQERQLRDQKYLEVGDTIDDITTRGITKGVELGS
jgi:hypothetical protein